MRRKSDHPEGNEEILLREREVCLAPAANASLSYALAPYAPLFAPPLLPQETCGAVTAVEALPADFVQPNTFFSALLEAAPEAILVLNAAGEITLCNGYTEKLFGYTRAELSGQAVEMLMPNRFHTIHPQHRGEYELAPRNRPMGSGQELWGLRQDGTEFPVEISLSPIPCDTGHLMLCFIRDVTERRQYEAQLQAQIRLVQEHSAQLEVQKQRLEATNRRLKDRAARDGLTGLYNHSMFLEQVEREYHRAVRTAANLSLIMLDVDHFKRYNDTYGHLAGDAVLQTLSRVLERTIRAGDIPARYGGEEFTVLLPDTGVAEACVVAERLRKRVSEYAWPNPPVAASFGVATLNLQTNTSLGLIAAADQALYHAKDTGRNRVVHHQSIAIAHDVSSPLPDDL